MKNPIEETLKTTAYYNNPHARPILRKLLRNFQEKPSISKAQKLEEYGITVDYDAVSTGEDLTKIIEQ